MTPCAVFLFPWSTSGGCINHEYASGLLAPVQGLDATAEADTCYRLRIRSRGHFSNVYFRTVVSQAKTVQWTGKLD